MRTNVQSLQGLAANIKVSPTPSSVTESTAILQKLSCFGNVNTFKKSNPTLTNGVQLAKVTSSQTYKVLFSSRNDLSSAISASPFSIDVNHDIPDPKSYDTYDVLGLHSRPKARPTSFTCEISADDDLSAHVESAKQIPFHGSFENDKQGTLYRALLETKAPSGIVRGISALSSDNRAHPSIENEVRASMVAQAVAQKVEIDQMNQGDRVKPVTKEAILAASNNKIPALSLMKMYRDSFNHKSLQKRDVPIRLNPEAFVKK